MTTILWDWNGTLLDDVALSSQVMMNLQKQYGLKPFENAEQYRSVFGFPVKEYYKTAGFDFSKCDWDEISHAFIRQYMSQSKNLQLNSQALQALDYARKRGWKNVILSASEKNNLLTQLEQTGLSDFFDGVYALDNIDAGSKEELACQALAAHEGSHVFMIGDTLHDADCADSAGIDCILYEGGHQNRQRLLKAKKPVVSSLMEAMEKIDERVRNSRK